MDRLLQGDHYLKAVEQYFVVVLFVFQFYPICHFEIFLSFRLGTVRSERANQATFKVNNYWGSNS